MCHFRASARNFLQQHQPEHSAADSLPSLEMSKTNLLKPLLLQITTTVRTASKTLCYSPSKHRVSSHGMRYDNRHYF